TASGRRFSGTRPSAARGLGVVASAIMLGLGFGGLGGAEAAARRKGEGYGGDAGVETDAAQHAAQDEIVRERATVAREFDPAEIGHGRHSDSSPPIALAACRWSSSLASIP